MTKFSGLGRGLESLIPKFAPLSSRQNTVNQNDEKLRHKESIFLMEVDKIKENPLQPRRDFNEEELQSLADSISEHGILQPLIVTKVEKESPSGIKVSYELIAGERRLRAAKISGLNFVPVIIRKKTEDKEKLELALVENLQRADLSPMEKAESFKHLAEDFGLTHYQIAEKVGCSREVISNTIRYLQLPDEVKKMLEAGKISEGHARTLLFLVDDRPKMVALMNEIMEKNLTVRAAETLSRQAKGVSKKVKSKATDPELKVMESQLEDFLGTRVQLARSGDRGKILIEFYSSEELDSILEKIMRS